MLADWFARYNGFPTGSTRENLTLDPQAVLHSDNRLYIITKLGYNCQVPLEGKKSSQHYMLAASFIFGIFYKYVMSVKVYVETF